MIYVTMKLMFRKVRKSTRLFLFLVPGFLGLAGLVLFFSIKSETLEGACSCDVILGEASGDFDLLADYAIYEGRRLSIDFQSFLALDDLSIQEKVDVLGVTSEEKWLEIDLSDQRIYAREGNKIVYNFLISSGRSATPTVKGEFRIWTKIKYAKMSGGKSGTSSYYFLPNVPYIQYFYNDYGLHGTYWHNNFGTPMSHGCVNLSIGDARKLFYWTTPVVPEKKGVVYSSKEDAGTRIVIHD